MRCKYAVLALADLARLDLAGATSEPYFWARFAQPCALVWAADERRARDGGDGARRGGRDLRRASPCRFAAATFDARALWTDGLAGDLRRRDPAGAAGRRRRASTPSDAARFDAATALALPDAAVAATPPIADGRHRFGSTSRRRAPARAPRLAGPPLSTPRALFLLRILRNALIFEGGVDYVLWKIQRHSGRRHRSDWRRKRHPLLALGAEAWRLYRAGVSLANASGRVTFRHSPVRGPGGPPRAVLFDAGAFVCHTTVALRSPRGDLKRGGSTGHSLRTGFEGDHSQCGSGPPFAAADDESSEVPAPHRRAYGAGMAASYARRGRRSTMSSSWSGFGAAEVGAAAARHRPARACRSGRSSTSSTTAPTTS